MTRTAPRQLPRGRHGLTREQVETDQRLRLFVGMSEAMHERGYVGTAVADIIARAGVSRETFYRLYDDKLACFLDGLDLVGAVLLDRLGAATAAAGGAPIERLERAIGAYVDALLAEPAAARLVLVEAHAAGPAALARRTAIQERVADALASLLGATGPDGAFACRMLVAAVSALVAEPLVAGDAATLRRLGPKVAAHARLLHDAGVFAR